MSTELATTYEDAQGSEQIVFVTDGTWLTTEIRGTRFEGYGFDGLAPTVPTHNFTLHHGDLRACSFTVHFPLRLIAPEGLRQANLIAEIKYGRPSADLGLDSGSLNIHLVQPEFDLHSPGRSVFSKTRCLPWPR